MTRCGPRQFALVRILLGGYLAVTLARLVPFAGDLLAADGAFATTPRSPFPNLLHVLGGRVGTPVFVAVLAALAVCLAAGVARPAAALGLWYGWACIVNRVPYLTVPSDGYVGWLLLVMAVAPRGERLGTSPEAHAWRLPAALHVGAWLVLALGYTVSGIDKLASPSWLDGSALRLMTESPIARAWWGADALRTVPDGLWRLATWSVLALEVGFAPLCVFRATRRLAWVAMAAVHLAVLVVLDIAEVSFAMLVFQLLVLDPGWLPGRGARASENGTAPGERTLRGPSHGTTAYGSVVAGSASSIKY